GEHCPRGPSHRDPAAPPRPVRGATAPATGPGPDPDGPHRPGRVADHHAAGRHLTSTPARPPVSDRPDLPPGAWPVAPRAPAPPPGGLAGRSTRPGRGRPPERFGTDPCCSVLPSSTPTRPDPASPTASSPGPPGPGERHAASTRQNEPNHRRGIRRVAQALRG